MLEQLTQWERELHVSRIIAGQTKYKTGKKYFYLINPSRNYRYKANEVYRDTLWLCNDRGLLTDDKVLSLLKKKKIWSNADDESLNEHRKELDNLKVALFENWSRSNARFTIRRTLEKVKGEITRLDNLRHCLDHLTCHGIATTAKIRYLIGTSLIYEDGSHFWQDDVSWNLPDQEIDDILEQIIHYRLGEAGIRELARTEPWRSIWATREACGKGLLDVAAVDLSDEQRNLILWSGMYDSVREHPEAPEDSILEDDDMLDGWLILQRRKRDSQQAKKMGDDIKNHKIRGADEIFIMADSIEDAKKVEELNDVNAKNIKSMRMAHLRNNQEVNEMHMPDTWQRLQMEIARMEQTRLTGK